MKAVVSGAAGFIGSQLVDALVDRGYRVIGIDRQSRVPGAGDAHRALDLADDPKETGLADLVADADLVFHLAARPGVRGSGPLVERLRWRDNVVASRNLLAVVPVGTPVVATSSSSVYGGSLARHDGFVASKENDPLFPRGGYARSKLAMERICESHRARGGVVAVVRPFTVAGEGQRADMAFSIWLDALRRGRPLEIFGSATRSRDITDIRDVVEGIVRAGERRVNETVNLGTGVGHRLVDMARALMDVSGLDGDISVQQVDSGEVDATLADTTRCQRLLGFTPRTDLTALLERQIEASVPLPAMAAT